MRGIAGIKSGEIDMKDPYVILGVAKNASISDIKKAYRGLAKKYHPDLNPGRKIESEVKFQEIQHAYECLGTPEAKSQFDRGETEKQQQQRGPSFYDTQQNGGRYSSVFEQNFSAEDIFGDIFAGAKSKAFVNEDELYRISVEFKEAAQGGEKIITLPNGKKLQVKIPAGIEEGKKLKFKGLATTGGDMYIQIAINPLEGFRREGQDILTELPISFFEAISGAEISVPTIDGQVILKIHPGVSTGSKLRIKHKGFGIGDTRGNQIMTIKIVMPREFNPKLKNAISEIEKNFSYNPRTTT